MSSNKKKKKNTNNEISITTNSKIQPLGMVKAGKILNIIY